VAEAQHRIHSYCIEYRPPAGLVDAPALRIVQVVEDSSARQAGIRAGDRLATYDGVTLRSVEDLRAAIAAASARERVIVVVYRGSQRLELEVPPGKLGVRLRGPGR
jgi:S1-C subfamily serine protease